MNPQTPLTVTPDHQLAMYRRMLLCRMFEERVYYLFWRAACRELFTSHRARRPAPLASVGSSRKGHDH